MKRKVEHSRRFTIGNLSFPIASSGLDLKTRRQSIYSAAFVKHVTISGLYQLWTGDRTLGRPFWILMLLLITGLGLRDIIVICTAVLTNDDVHTEQQLKFDQNKLEFANISVCVPITFDGYRVSQDVTIPEEALRHMKHENWTVEYIYEEFTRYVSFYNIYDQVNSPTLKRILQLIMADESNGPFVNGPGEAVDRYLPHCQETIISCTLADKPFNCCNITRMDIGQASICYTVMLNRNSTKLFQSVPGPNGGLTMDVVWNGTNAFYLDNLADEGLYLFVSEVPDVLSLPSVVWPFTNVYVRLVSKQRRLIDKCYATPPDLEFIDYYDPAATNCIVDFQIKVFDALMGCEMPLPPYIPKLENVCTIGIGKALVHMLVQGSEQYLPNQYNGAVENMFARASSRLTSVVGSSENTSQSLENTMFNPPYCKRLCNYPYYDKIVSYATLASNTSDFDMDNETILRSRITVYFGDFDYFIISDKFAVNGYVAFNQIGSILGVYAGISVVTFVQVLVYGTAGIYNYIKRKTEHWH